MATSLEVAAKYALLSFDATMRSNVTVGPPIDLLMYKKNSFEMTRYRRLSAFDQDLNVIHASWEQSLRRAVEQLPEIDFDEPDPVQHAAGEASAPALGPTDDPADHRMAMQRWIAIGEMPVSVTPGVHLAASHDRSLRRLHASTRLRRDARRQALAAAPRLPAAAPGAAQAHSRGAAGAASSRRTSPSSIRASPSPSTAATKGPSGSSRTTCCRGSSRPPTGTSSSAA